MTSANRIDVIGIRFVEIISSRAILVDDISCKYAAVNESVDKILDVGEISPSVIAYIEYEAFCITEIIENEIYISGPES